MREGLHPTGLAFSTLYEQQNHAEGQRLAL